MTATETPDLFVRENDQLVLNPDASWVIETNATPTVMWTGRKVTFDNGSVDELPADDPQLVEAVKRYSSSFACPGTEDDEGERILCEDPGFCGHEGAKETFSEPIPDGVYSIVGPTIEGNPHRVDRHFLKPHSGPGAVRVHVTEDLETGTVNQDINPETLRAYFLGASGVSCLVWNHEDGRTAKAVASDYISQGVPQ